MNIWRDWVFAALGVWPAAWRRFKWAGEPGQGYSCAYKALVPVQVRRWGGPMTYIRNIPSRIRGLSWRTWHRTQNLWWDTRAVWAGYCNARSYPSGYRHWRCGRRRGHYGSHRHHNYTWFSGGKVEYNPWEHTVFHLNGEAYPRQPRAWERHMTPTLRQSWDLRRLDKARMREVLERIGSQP